MTIQLLKTTRGRITLVGSLVAATLIVGHSLRTRPSAAHAAAPTSTAKSAVAAGSKGAVHATASVDRTAVLPDQRDVRVELVLKADASRTAARVPTDVIVVLDRSGSMAGARIEHAKAAAHEFIDGLDEGDRFGLVTYDTDARVTIPLTTVHRHRKASLKRVVSAIQPGSSTNIAAGLDLAAAQLGHEIGRAARVVLISDGETNTGDTSMEGMTRRARNISHHAAVTSIGVGEGFNEVVMAGIADAGVGNYYYLEQLAQLAEILAAELESTRETVATQLAVTLNPEPGMHVVSAAGYPLTRSGRKVSFRPGHLFAGQERRIWVTYRVDDVRRPSYDLGRTTVTFEQEGRPSSIELDGFPRIAVVRTEEAFVTNVDKEVWSRSAAIEGLSALKMEVADHVRRGDKTAAESAIRAYRDRNERLNASIQSEPVAQSLEETEQLERELDDAFTGANQAYKQNVYSKKQSAKGWDGRRQGSKRSK